MILAHRIRLDPNNVQATALVRAAGAARFAWNWGLARWQMLYAIGEKPTWQRINKDLNATKDGEHAWLREIDWMSMNGAIADLGKAFRAFFRRVKAGKQPGYPRFKKKGVAPESIAVDGRQLRFDGRRVRLPKIGWLRMREAVRFQGRILTSRVSKRVGHWYLSLQIEVDASWSYPHRCETQATVGVDLGVVDLAVLSDGTRVAAPRVLRRSEARLRMLQKEMSRRTNGGKNRAKTRSKIARLHERIANVRKDVTHKFTTMLVKAYRWIGIEDLCVKGMARGRLAKSVLDAALAEVRRQLMYKAVLAGANVVIADRWFPSSKMCSRCGVVRDELALSTRRWQCECGAEHDRDENAARNLMQLAAARAVTACCPGVTLALVGQESGSHVNCG